MRFSTDERLKSYLDTNQLYREQMCLAVLALDKRFSEVRPRHPRGGPDGGRDIEAVFRGEQRAFAAVGFVNQADDSDGKKRRMQQTFSSDVRIAAEAVPAPDAFFFLTNVNFTLAEKDELTAEARKRGCAYCEVFDRERIRIALDSPDGLSVRFQYLDIPLSDAEQASFFARWGDDIHSLISTGFQRVHSTLDRLLFLQEATDPLAFLLIDFELDRIYQAEDIGHFRAFCSMYLKEPKHKILSVLFGSSDNAERMRADAAGGRDAQPGIKCGISGGQWEQYWEVPEGAEGPTEPACSETFKQVGWSSSVGVDRVRAIRIQYSKDCLIRLVPTLALRDLCQADFLPIVSSSLAGKISCIHAFANEYKLVEVPRRDFYIDRAGFDPMIPVQFTADELADPWVRIRPNEASSFQFSFSEQTPCRLFSPRQTQNSVSRRTGA